MRGSKCAGLLVGILVPLLRGNAKVVAASGLKDIEHVIIFMQENRSWDTYFGTMAGARGFNDPNVQVNPDGRPVWFQPVDPNMSNETDYLLPWHLGYLGGNWSEAIQCASGGSNGYQQNHAAINGGLNDGWARNNTPWSWGYLKREDLLVQFAMAEAWTVGDMYQQSQITATNPNRVTLASGSINAPGSPQSLDQGGVYLDNNETPGCEKPNVNCYPLKWKTIFEYYQSASVTWQIYQDTDNFDDNPLAWFEQYQTASSQSPLSKRGMAFLGLDRFYQDASMGTLPMVSFIVGPRELSEHAPYSPKDGAWLQERVVEAVVGGKKYGSSVLLVSYDESGGWGDHVPPYHSPEGTPGEWVDDPLGLYGNIYTGPGSRVPFYIISPFTRGGHVLTENADHNSQILFIEEWLTAKGYEDVRTDQMVHWRREHMSNLLSAFDFENPDMSIPSLPKAPEPHKDGRGVFDGAAYCESRFSSPRPPVPYANQPRSMPRIVEEGFKPCRGNLTEGRYLVFADRERGNMLSHDGGKRLGTLPNPSGKNNTYNDKRTRWVLHYISNPANVSEIDIGAIATRQEPPFLLSSFDMSVWLSRNGSLVRSRRDAVGVDIVYKTRSGNGRGYTLRYANSGDGGNIEIEGDGDGVRVGDGGGDGDGRRWDVVSVTYYD
ncbi:hypothetical protein AJ80_06783 [Polytolypa hystricis UAMH7299]|uniref:Phospholipase C n=1 Tax=Polytolypa hystricis (strain UAMH7299) TaxID=1447883 RepID=A0A2B7XTI0_POLH7|nr:hypothetical protein AJ80_06783 [Polytolypa hystricis UAMH7299]